MKLMKTKEMTRSIAIVAFVGTMMMVAGCAGIAKQVAALSHNSREDVFVVASSAARPPAGYARLHVSASLKTHEPGAHAAKDAHGTPAHQLLVNIDGQVVAIGGSLLEEESEALPVRDPEEGEGVRYRFEKTLDVREGSRTVSVVVATDHVVVSRQVRFVGGSSNELVLEPVYGATAVGHKPGWQPTSSFRQGLTTLRFCVNGQLL